MHLYDYCTTEKKKTSFFLNFTYMFPNTQSVIMVSNLIHMPIFFLKYGIIKSTDRFWYFSMVLLFKALRGL